MTDRMQIVVHIASDGIVNAETKNILGAKCLDYISLLEKILAADTVSSEYTKDYERQQNSTEQEVHGELPQN